MASLDFREKAFADDKETMEDQEKVEYQDILDNPAILESQVDFCAMDRPVLNV